MDHEGCHLLQKRGYGVRLLNWTKKAAWASEIAHIEKEESDL